MTPTGKATLITAQSALIASLAGARVVNLKYWGDNQTLNLTLYLLIAGTTTTAVTTLAPDRVRRIDNWVNRWLLEFFEGATQFYCNSKQTIPEQVAIEAIVAALLGSRMARLATSLVTRDLASTVGINVLHPVTELSETRIEPIKMLEPLNSHRVATLLCLTLKVAAAVALVTWDVPVAIKGGSFVTGYSLGILGRVWTYVRLRFKANDDFLDEGPGCAERMMNVMSTLYTGIYPVILGASIGIGNNYTLCLAGMMLSAKKDLEKVRFQHLPVGKVMPPKRVLELNRWDAIHSVCLGAMYAWITYMIVDTKLKLPSKIALASFATTAIIGWVATRYVYIRFHESDQNRLINQLYFYLVKNPEFQIVIYALLRGLTDPTDTQLDSEKLMMTIAGCIALALFGFGWGNNRALQGLLSSHEVDYNPPPFLAQYEIGKAQTKFFSGNMQC